MRLAHGCSRFLPHVLMLGFLASFLLASCSPPVQKPTGPAADYQNAKEMFQKGRWDRVTEFTDGLASASPPNTHTQRALVLRVILFSGEVNAYKELADAYDKGSTKTKNPRFQAEYSRLRHDNLEYAMHAALGLGEATHSLLADGALPKQLVLEAPYPTTEGPVEVKDLARVADGGWIEPDQQESAALDAVRKGIDDVLGKAVGGDRSKAREALASGSTKIEGVDFAIFLGNQLLQAASIFDKKHSRDSQRFKTLSDEVNEAVKTAQAFLKDNPDKDKQKALKKLQDDIKAEQKNL